MKFNTPKNILASIKTNNFLAFALMLVVISFVLYANTLKNGYNMDDNLVTQHHTLTSKKELSTITNIFTSPYFKDEIGNSYGYRPIVLVSFFIEHFLLGESPLISHFFNLFLYGLVVVLFYKLLANWFGTNGLMIAMLSAILFAVHPIHTEVVASIKNRDEILAFLFIICAGLSIMKYLTNNNWILLFVILCFSTLAMLSKKSVYPMVLILPIAIIYFKEINIKQLTLFSITLIIPASIIGSNLQLDRLVFMSTIPFLGVCCAYYLKIFLQKDLIFEMDKINKLLSIVSWVLLIMTISQSNNYYIIIFLGFSILFVKKNKSWNIVQLVLQLIIISFFSASNSFSMAAFFISLIYYNESISKNKPDKKLMYLTVFACLFFQITNMDLHHVIVLLTIVFFFYFISRKPSWGLLYAFVAFISNVFFSIELWHTIMLSYSIIYFLNSKKKSSYFESTSLKVILVIISINLITPLTYTFQSINLPNNLHNYLLIEQKNKPSSATQQIQTTSVKNFMYEGRKLEYVENTLVTPHLLTETIGTGFLTLAEYARLMVFPKELSFYYGYSKIKTVGLNNSVVWYAIVFYLGLILLAIWQANKRPIITIGIVWFILSILLFSNWPDLVAGMVGERLAFTASAGFSIFVAGIVLWIKPNFSFSKPQRVEFIIFTIILLLGARTIVRNSDWKNPITLMSHDIKHLDNSSQANNLYANALMKEANADNQISQEIRNRYKLQAIDHFKKAISIYPKFYNASYDLGRAYIEVNDFKNAKLAFEQTYKIDPENILPLEELTKTSFDLKQKFDTEYYGNMYLEKQPNNENIHELIAYIMLINNEKAKAKAYSERGLRYFPNNQNLQQILSQSSK